MKPKKMSGPMLFCEWVIGGPIPPARRRAATKSEPKQRDVIRVEVTTDDEAEEDTLKITYPRSGKGSKGTDAAKAETVVKKVRFDEETKKSALKQSRESSEGETTSDASASEDSEAEKSDGKAKKKKDEKTQASSSSGETEDDSEPHPTCKCSRCVKQRKKKQGQKGEQQKSKTDKKASICEKVSDTETSDSAIEESKKPAKGGKKCQEKGKGQGKKDGGSEADDEASVPASKNKQKKDNKSNAEETKNDKEKSGEGGDEKNKKADAQSNKEASKGKDTDTTPPLKKPSYPEAFPAPHARRPNLIAPIRAQVVQTEDVVESPEDPPPNAFYDAEHNVMRVYYGPVYGNHSCRSLYPRRDSTSRPLPVGMPHPGQNPYHYGFGQLPPQQGYDNVPITQGMPAPSWNLFTQPPGFPPFLSGQEQVQRAEAKGNKGAFSKKGNSPLAANVSQADDVPGRSNIAPSNPKASRSGSPYYNPSKTAEALRNSATTSPNKNTVPASQDNTTWNDPSAGPGTSQPDNSNNNDSGWSNSAGHHTQQQQAGGNTWGDSANDTQAANGGWDNDGDANAQTTDGNTGSDGWPTEANAPVGSAGDGDGNGGAEWNDNNVGPQMPGSWEGAQPAATTADWRDASMAASTNGKIDTTW